MLKRHGLIRVLVIDDSAFSRQTITRMLETSPLVEVVGIAALYQGETTETWSVLPDHEARHPLDVLHFVQQYLAGA